MKSGFTFDRPLIALIDDRSYFRLFPRYQGKGFLPG